MKHTTQHMEKAFEAYAEKFGTSKEQAIADYFLVEMSKLMRSRQTERADIEITCQVCADDAWWQENYGFLWQAAQWWACGPFGLNCASNPEP